MAKMSGLGKGLDALFGPAPEEEQMQENDVLKNLKITEVEPNREQPRKRFDQEALEELADSIKEYGLIQPIVVSKKDGYYSIIAGERRWRASKIAGLKEIPAIIREDDEKINSEISLIENMQREDLNPYEKALGIRNLIDNYGLSQEIVAKKLGKSRSNITNVLGLLRLPSSVQNMILDGKLSMGHARELSKLEDNDQIIKYANEIIKNGLSVRDIEKISSSNNLKKAHPIKRNKNDLQYKYVENKLGEIFGTRVKVFNNKLEISFDNDSDLDRILEIMNIKLN